ncbi:MAG: bifunctional diaminohydroxyphosphoribosylaminopyrimidine deaminase/5-amino-6-(5-phosphoribosylamino)uracil reductase RibD, partial [Bacteroidota bacterium]
MSEKEYFMHRCLELAKSGLGTAAPNPMVGCVIVHQNTVIGEGYHHKYGEPHAEVNAIRSVKNKDLLKKSTLYVSLEPCCHHGKTPPCTDLIIAEQIPEVVIGTIDPYDEVAGQGVARLRNYGVKVDVGVLRNESIRLNKRFFTYHQKK